MKISTITQKRPLTLSFEIFPPKRETALDSVLSTAQQLARWEPDFISVTYGAGGSTQAHTVEIASSLQTNTSIPALAHLTCVGASQQAMEESIARMKAAHIENVLALRGDLPQGQSASSLAATSAFQHASDLVSLLKKHDFCVGGACYPEGHPESGSRNRDMDYLTRKVEAGCDFLTTQMFFDNDMLYSFLYQIQLRNIHVPVIAGIMPITRAEQISRMLELSNAYVPRKLLMLIDRFRDKPDSLRQAGIAYAVAQIIDLVSNGIRGIHIYTMNRSDIVNDILAATGSIFRDERKDP